MDNKLIILINVLQGKLGMPEISSIESLILEYIKRYSNEDEIGTVLLQEYISLLNEGMSIEGSNEHIDKLLEYFI